MNILETLKHIKVYLVCSGLGALVLVIKQDSNNCI